MKNINQKGILSMKKFLMFFLMILITASPHAYGQDSDDDTTASDLADKVAEKHGGDHKTHHGLLKSCLAAAKQLVENGDDFDPSSVDDCPVTKLCNKIICSKITCSEEHISTLCRVACDREGKGDKISKHCTNKFKKDDDDNGASGDNDSSDDSSSN